MALLADGKPDHAILQIRFGQYAINRGNGFIIGINPAIGDQAPRFPFARHQLVFHQHVNNADRQG